MPRRLRAALGVTLVTGLGATGLATTGLGPAGLTPTADAAGEAATDSRVIVVMDDAPSRSRAATAQRDLLAAAADAGVEAEVEHQLTGLIDAVAMTVPAGDVNRLAELPGVADVVPDRRMRAATDVSVPLIGAPQVWEQEAPVGGPADGAGTVVAVVDTGVDYTNPSLGGAFGPGNKIVAGHDFVNGDDDPMDDNGHGTHVAGIVAGDGAVTGVAPGALMTAYKVLDGGGDGWESDIIAGLEAAVDPANPYRADVVNLSLGGPGDGTDPLGQAATAAAEAGVVVVAAAGNSGPGENTVGTPAVADGVLSVGASASGMVLPTARMVAPRVEPVDAYRAPYSASPPTQPVSGELVDVGAGTEADYDRVGDVTGKVVAYRANIPGDLAAVQPHLLDQARLAEERGALALLAYSGGGGGPVLMSETAAPSAPGEIRATDAEPGIVDVPLSGAESGESFRMDRIVVMGLMETQWARLQSAMAEGPVSIEITGEDVTDQVASFSSRGPTRSFELEPDLVAPGVEIRSTWPLAQWAPGIYRISGTSMAAPHVAGAAALVRQLHPDASVEEVGGRLVGSAAATAAGPSASGSGRLDVEAAVAADVIAEPTSVSLGLADLAAPVLDASGTTTLRNTGDTDIAVTLGAEPAADSAGTAVVSPAQGVIPPGGELRVEVTVSADRPDQDADLAGWVVASLAGSMSTVRVPYLLSARHVVVQTSPDPSDGASAAFIWSPAQLEQPPTVTVTPPAGQPYTVTAEHEYDSWYRAELTGSRVGAYDVAVSALTTLGATLTGGSGFEVTAPLGSSASPARWQPIGPNAESGPIATTPADRGTAAVTQYLRAGPWTTDDGGETWEQRNRLPVAAGTGNDNLVVSANDPDVMWYAVNGSSGGAFDLLVDPSYQGRILRTEDGGDTWQPLDVPDVHVIALLSDPRTQVLVAVTADAVLVSRDGGDTWSAHANPVGGNLSGGAVGGDDLYLATYDGVWAVRGLLAGDPTGTDQVFTPASGLVEGLVADDSLVAVLGDDVVTGSWDGGNTWADLYTVPGGGALDIVLDGDVLMVTTYRPVQHVSRDGGTTWSQVAQPVNGAIEDDAVAWGDGLLWSSPGAGLFQTGDDGADPRRIGVQGATAYDLAVVEDADGTARLLAGTDADVFGTDLPTRPKLPDGVAEWGLSGYEAYVGTRVGQLAVDPQDPATVWKIRKDALSQFWVYRSTDGGASWQVRGRTNELPFDIVVSPTDSDLVAVAFWSLGGVGLYVTHDAGATWDKHFHDQVFTTVATDPADPDRLWLGSSDGLYRSDDFGVSAEKVADGQVSAVAVDEHRVVAAGAAIRVSEDGGQTFAVADSGDLPMLVSEVLVSPSDPVTWYAATGAHTANGLVKGGRGVLRSTDGGHTWVNVSSGLQNLSVVSLTASPDGRWLYAGTENGGVHRVRAR
ncbi:S8 family serine peptidase [Jiangella asiatica]|uniref:Peptidase S8/S53 domain-containing protein n=1 Tax=Jiangella asiatica TaxID=2530372 RepID=A0A4R5CIQ1_9ACTN|nr:S8 family serine peptidase [Jiangella asiatica]TDD98996.1 hypothetical protein E1269_27970 [Jiangella asiatica]